MTGFLPTHVIERNLRYERRDLVEICMEIRNIVAGIAPHATERLVKNRLTYHDESRGGPVKAGICGVSLHADHVRVHFPHGAFLKDASGLLEGDRLAMRYLRIPSYADAPWKAITALIRSSADFRPETDVLR